MYYKEHFSNPADYAFVPLRTTEHLKDQSLWKWHNGALSTDVENIKKGKSGIWFSKKDENTYTAKTNWGHLLTLSKNAVNLQVSKDGKAATIFNMLKSDNKPNFPFIYGEDNGKNCVWYGPGVELLSFDKMIKKGGCDKSCLRYQKKSDNCDLYFDTAFNAEQYYKEFLLNKKETWDNFLTSIPDKYYLCNQDHACVPTDMDKGNYKDLKECETECGKKKWWKCDNVLFPCVPAFDNEPGAIENEGDCNANCHPVLAKKTFKCEEGKCVLTGHPEDLSKEDCEETCGKDSSLTSYIKNPITIMLVLGITLFLTLITYFMNQGMFIMFLLIFIIQLGFLGYYMVTNAISKVKSSTVGKILF